MDRITLVDYFATMASPGVITEGGANEEFSDIIKWRSGAGWVTPLVSLIGILSVTDVVSRDVLLMFIFDHKLGLDGF